MSIFFEAGMAWQDSDQMARGDLVNSSVRFKGGLKGGE
jgi:hypothetical protein